MIERTEAIVLRRLNYGETSQIVTLFTRERGVLTVIAKGARGRKSRFGSTLQPMSYIQVVYYYKATRDLQTLTESSHVRAFHDIARDVRKIAAGLRAMELTYALTQREDPNPRLFGLLVTMLEGLDATQARADNVLLYFEMRFAALLGFAPAVDRAAVERVPHEGALLALDSGTVVPLEAQPRAARRASRSALRAYAVFARADLDVVMRMEMTPAVRAEVHSLVDDYLRYHVEEAYPDQTAHVIGSLLHPFEDEEGGD